MIEIKKKSFLNYITLGSKNITIMSELCSSKTQDLLMDLMP